MEQSRSLLESQRLNFEREREIFEKERKLWNAERGMLKARIANLEFSLNKNTNGRRRFSNDAPSLSGQSFLKDARQRSMFSTFRTSRGSSEPNGGHPIWETPDMGATVTRVFSNEEQQAQSKKSASVTNGLPSIAEGATEKPLPPHSVAVPVAMLDSSLDGITLKSAGLESSFVKVSSPISTSPPQLPSPGPRIHNEGKTLRVKLDGLVPPLDRNLVMNAGHTPMEFGVPAISETASGVESRKSPEAEAPPPKQESGSDSDRNRLPRPPSERSDSYFFNTLEVGTNKEIVLRDGDVELKGPLTMENKQEEGQDNLFLDQLDARLLVESQRPRQESISGSDGKMGFGKIDDEVDDGGPRLKLKKSMNFGSVYGSRSCGNI